MNSEDKKIWMDLYDVASKIYDLKPWNRLWDMDLFMYLSESGDMYYFCTMGKAGMHTGINVYKNTEILSFLDMAKNEVPQVVMINYQECLSLEFVKKDDTLPNNLKLIKELGLKFRGTWTSFERFEKGYAPRSLDINQAKELCEVLPHYLEMLKEYDKGAKVDFNNKEIYFGRFKGGKLVCEASELMIPFKKISPIIADDSLIKSVKKAKRSSMKLEYDFLNYLPIRIEGMVEDDGKMRFPRLRMIADEKSLMILKSNLVDMDRYKSEEDYLNESVQDLLSFICEYGIPEVIYVRDDEAIELLSDFSSKTGIKVLKKENLNVIDITYEEILYGNMF